MEQEHKDLLTRHLVLISDRLPFHITKYFIYLLSKRIFSSELIETIRCRETPKEQALEFYFHLIRRGSKAFPEFLRAIRQHDIALFCTLRQKSEDREIIDQALL